MKSLGRILGLVVVWWCLWATRLEGLHQIQNGSFTLDLGGWTIKTPFLSAQAFSSIARDTSTGFPSNSCILQYVKDNSGSNNLFYPADAYIQQVILANQRPAPSNAVFGFAHRESAPNNQEWIMTLSGTLRNALATETVLLTLFEEIHSSYASLHLTWNQPASVTTVLAASTTYVYRVYADFSCWKGNTLTAWVDVLTCNVSPCGLVASETATGACLLTWASSTWPATGVPPLKPTNGYLVWSGPTATGPWTNMATTTNPGLFIASPPADEYYFCLSDVDVNNEQSPLSPVASFKRAALQITKVENFTSKVTKGQTGLPVKVYITNPGNSPALFGGASLTFVLPANGVYSWQRTPTPASGTLIPPGGSIVCEFLVGVGTDSASGLDFIDATVRGVNAQTGAAISDMAADQRAAWLVQEPAHLTVRAISAPSLVYRDQTGVPLYLEILNDGEADAWWDDTELVFQLGEYLNITPQVPFPVYVPGGLATTVRFDLDVAVTSATGTTTIDAHLAFRDVNTGIADVNLDGVHPAPTWTILAGILRTYRGPPQFPAWVAEASSFNVGDFFVYAKGINLIPDREYRFRWFDPDGFQVAYSDPPDTTDLNGNLYGMYKLSALSPLGKWRVIVTRTHGTTPLCEQYFDVVVPASLSVRLTLPPHGHPEPALRSSHDLHQLRRSSDRSRLSWPSSAPGHEYRGGYFPVRAGPRSFDGPVFRTGHGDLAIPGVGPGIIHRSGLWIWDRCE
ncbi:MAG: hypothetical protein OZSIB_2415 [Candidatus Ozemobacter sibiricus]|uniref:Uncharacterized protein n=1 Tax=Candidatus Ozemobacter sibiricus TaxID=2268124 RepID=A0A367ZSD8_9BACT|nr:MAG: hypothetical protein OZSIB_2415 [Candidatus Ozemobacter sibiricus]